jgi:RND family efflux transporter MFP subunit
MITMPFANPNNADPISPSTRCQADTPRPGRPPALALQEAPGPMRLFSRWRIILALAFVAGAGASACAARASAPPPAETTAPVPVRTAPIVWADRVRPIHAIGTLFGKEEVSLSFKVGGLVERIFVDEGARVAAGQTLATLKRSEISAGVLQARRAFEKAIRDRARVEELFRGRAATLEQSQDSETAVDVARAALDAAVFNEEHAVIRAPAGGTVLRRMAEPDEVVAPGTPVLRLRAAARGWVVRAGVSDRDVMRIALGNPVDVTFAALPDQTFIARVSEIAESATAMTGTYELEVRLEGLRVPLRSGLIAQITLHPTPTGQARYAFVPIEALLEGTEDRATVFVAKPVGAEAGGADGSSKSASTSTLLVERRAVRVAFLDGTEAAIAHGLEGASAVITDGAHRISGDDAKVIEGSTPAVSP